MINSVAMINWRAYDQHQVGFNPGITFIMGANGVGKTTILEAIAYALTGEPSTVRDRAKLLRDPTKLATVRLSFTIDGQVYAVERSQSSKRAESASLTRAGEGRKLANTHKGVTVQIERLMGISADFLQRIIYMAEGDVFRFLNKPPGRALDLQIRRVLGLTQLDEFTSALKAAEKEIKSQITTVRGLLEQFEQIDVHDDGELEQRLYAIDGRRSRLLDSLRSVQDKIARHRRESEDLLRLKPLIEKALQTLERHPGTLQTSKPISVPALFSKLKQQAEGAQSSAQKHQIALARLEGEQQAYQRVLDILLPYVGHTDTVPCPVCGKPMTVDERESVIQDIKANQGRITEEQKRLTMLQDEARRASDELEEQVESLRELRNFLTHVSFQSVNHSANITNLPDAVRLQLSELQDRLEELRQQARAIEEGIAGLESERAEYMTLQSRLQNLGYTALVEAREALVGLETRSLSLRAARRAAQDTLAVQRNVDMQAIYAQIAQVWEAFLGRKGWRLQLDSGGMPLLEDDQGRQFDLSQFSGGEKTALLVILHTIIARHFSRSDFLLMDEPLEHLDPVNRRSLIRFLVSAYHRNAFNQVIVTTFEESLIRKYIGAEGVSVIHL